MIRKISFILTLIVSTSIYCIPNNSELYDKVKLYVQKNVTQKTVNRITGAGLMIAGGLTISWRALKIYSRTRQDAALPKTWPESLWRDIKFSDDYTPGKFLYQIPSGVAAVYLGYKLFTQDDNATKNDAKKVNNSKNAKITKKK